jgi:hypothetical protein
LHCLLGPAVYVAPSCKVNENVQKEKQCYDMNRNTCEKASFITHWLRSLWLLSTSFKIKVYWFVAQPPLVITDPNYTHRFPHSIAGNSFMDIIAASVSGVEGHGLPAIVSC